jgi:MFS family permease
LGRNKTLYVIGVFLGVFYMAVYANTQGVLLTEVIRHYSLESAQKGYMNSAYNFGSLIACLSAMFVMGRLTKAKLYAFGLGASAVCLLVIGLAPAFWALIAMTFLVGIALGYVDQLGSSITADLFSGRRKAQMLCTLHAVFGFAGIVMAPVTNRLIESGLVWNRVYTFVGGMGLVVTLAFLGAGWERVKGAIEASDAHPLTKKELWGYIASNRRILLMLAMSFNTIMCATISAWLFRYYELRFDAAAMGAIVLSVYWVAVTVSRLVTGSLPIRAVPLVKWTGFLTAALLGVGYASKSPYVLAVTAPLSALLGGATVPIMLSRMSDEAPENTFLTTTIGIFCVYFGQTITPTIMGALENAWGIQGCMYFGVAAALLQGLVLIPFRDGVQRA